MLREIINRLDGKKKVVNETISFQTLQEILAGLDKTIKINIEYFKPGAALGNYLTFNDIPPFEIVKLLGRKEFQPDPYTYSDANHQVFAGEKDEVHYIDLRVGSILLYSGDLDLRDGQIISKAGTREQRGSFLSRVILNYTLLKEKN